ncbi:MAG: hypothetical protein ACFFD8_07780 [Candidatus Thorarchaeota archaeon]
MTDLRDKLLTLDRKGLEREADKLGIKVNDSMSRAELITLIEKQYALQEFGELKSFSEHRILIIGLFFVTLATFLLAILTLFQLQVAPQNSALLVVLAPIYIVFRGLGGFLIAAALISLALKTGYQNITPVLRASLIIGAVLIIIVVLVWVPLPTQWVVP